MMILTDRRERIRFIRFAIVGTIGAFVDFATLNILVSIFYMPAVSAQAVSFSAAVINNYFLNRYWTYPDSRTKSVSRQLFEFTVVSVLGLIIRSVIFSFMEPALTTLFTHSLLALPFTPEAIARNLTLAFVIGVIMFWNFFVNRYWTFADVD